jgi:hypothetical protein
MLLKISSYQKEPDKGRKAYTGISLLINLTGRSSRFGAKYESDSCKLENDGLDRLSNHCFNKCYTGRNGIYFLEGLLTCSEFGWEWSEMLHG